MLHGGENFGLPFGRQRWRIGVRLSLQGEIDIANCESLLEAFLPRVDIDGAEPTIELPDS